MNRRTFTSRYAASTLNIALCAAFAVPVTLTGLVSTVSAQDTPASHAPRAPQNPAENPTADNHGRQAPRGEGHSAHNDSPDQRSRRSNKTTEVDKEQQEIDRLLKSPVPSDVDGLLKRVEAISRLAGATNDKVEELKIKVAGAEKRAKQSRTSAEKAQRAMKASQKRYAESRKSVEYLSQARYRGATVDPVSAIAGASGPAAAMDRSAYLAALQHDANGIIDAADKNLADAQRSRSTALRATAQADFQLADVRAKQEKLEKRSAQLDRLKKEVKKAVDGLSPADRRRWVDRNGPIDVDVKLFLGQMRGEVGKNASGVVAAALSKLGAPYGWGAAGPDQFDCSGLMYWSYQQQGKTIPRTSQAQLAGGKQVSMSELQPGDIVAYYPGATHVGMYIGDGKLVHASDYGIPVQVVPVDSMPVVGAVRY